jgi:hypothetical protein
MERIGAPTSDASVTLSASRNPDALRGALDVEVDPAGAVDAG